MQNPARELAAILQAWGRVPSRTTIRTHRGVTTGEPGAWDSHLRAAALLLDVERFIAALEASDIDVQHYRRAIPAWAAGVIAPDHAWNASQVSDFYTVTPEMVDMLRALADVIDRSDIAVSLSVDTKAASIAALDEVTELLRDVHLTPATRQYVFELLTACRRVFSESATLGSVDLLSRVHELIGALHMLADSLAEDDPAMKLLAKKLRAAVKRVAPYLSFGVQATAGVIGVAADLNQLTG